MSFGNLFQRETVTGDVRQWGAYCDGTHDDAAAINNEEAYFAVNGGGVILIPAGAHPCALGSPVYITGDGIEIRGSARSKVTMGGTSTGSALRALYGGFDIIKFTANWANDVIADISLGGTSMGITTCCYAIDGSSFNGGPVNFVVRDLYVNYGWNGIYLAGANGAVLDSIKIEMMSGTEGIYEDDNAFSGSNIKLANIFVQPLAQGNKPNTGTSCLRLRGATEVDFTNGSLNECDAGIRIEPSNGNVPSSFLNFTNIDGSYDNSGIVSCGAARFRGANLHFGQSFTYGLDLNMIGSSCSLRSGDMEFANVSVANSLYAGIRIGGGDLTFTNPFVAGNSNASLYAYDGIDIQGGSKLTFVGGQSSASLPSGNGAATQKWGIEAETTFSGSLNVKGIELSKNGTSGTGGPMSLDGTPSSLTNVSIFGNTGIDDVTNVSAPASSPLPLPLNPVFRITGSAATITNIQGGWLGRQVVLTTLPVITFSNGTGSNILTPCMSTHNVPVAGTYTASGWILRC
jgi:hypothetical protein